MMIIGIDPGISGAICFMENGKIIDVIEMPNMTDGKKNKKQVNGSQIFNEISFKIKDLKKDNNLTLLKQNQDAAWIKNLNNIKKFSIEDPQKKLERISHFKKLFNRFEKNTILKINSYIN